LLALMQTPHRFRSKRQLWTYSGLGIETHDSAQYRYVRGQLQRLGRTEFLTRTIQSEPRLETRKTTTRAKWRSSPSVYRSVLKNELDTADIVRDGDITSTTGRADRHGCRTCDCFCSASLEAPELDEVWDETRMVVGSVSNDGSTSIVERFTLDDRPKH
jgi:hypothetical protein